MAKLGVAIDVGTRCAVLVVCWLLMREFWGAEGSPVPLLIGPLIVYAGWNVWIITRCLRRWRAGSIGEMSFLVNLGALSIVRLYPVLLLADDLWWHHRDRLMVLVATSVVTAVLTLGVVVASNAMDRWRPRRAS
jgi:hypothetical protein